MTQLDQVAAWLYTCHTAPPRHDLTDSFVQQHRAKMDPRYWTETPLYAHASEQAAWNAALEAAERCAMGFPGIQRDIRALRKGDKT